MTPKMIHRNAAQYIKGKAFLHLYECPKCSEPTATTASGASKMLSCYRCRSVRHGESRSTLYFTWKNMRYRCSNQRCKSYRDYGARGISVCEEWSLYESFRDWALSNGWKEGLEIDRIDNDRGYSPSNCRIVTRLVNRQRTRRIKLSPEKADAIRAMAKNGDRKVDIAKRFDVHVTIVYDILNGILWPSQLHGDLQQGVTEPESASRSPQGE